MHLLRDFITIRAKVCFIVLNKTQTVSVSCNITLYGSKIRQSNKTVYARCLLQANMKTDRLTERVYKTAKSKIHSLYCIGVNSSYIHPVQKY